MLTMNSVTIRQPGYILAIEPDKQRLTISSATSATPYLISSLPLLLFPEIAGVDIAWEGATFRHLPASTDEASCLRITAHLHGALTGVVCNEIYCHADRLICHAEYTADREHGLASWQLAPAGSTLAMETAHAMIGEAYVNGNGRVFPVADIKVSTASHNWGYFPNAPRLVLRRGTSLACVGGTSLAHDFGLELACDGNDIRYFRFDYGGQQTPFPVRAQAPEHSPRLQWLFTREQSDVQAHATFTRSMIDDGIISPKHYLPEADCWLRPWYCTWGDEVGLARAMNGGTMASGECVKAMLTQERVLSIARFIREEELNFGTIIIDEGWQDARGDWNLARERFPDMRGLVDQLHAMDFQVALWWAPLLTEPGAAIRSQTDLLRGPTKHQEFVLDYTNPCLREHISRKLDTWFSDAPSGWDIDGIKLDFIAEKIYPTPQVEDREWYGEERTIHHIYRMVHDIASRYTSLPFIWGSSYNPHLSPFITAAASEERFDSDLAYLADRPALVEALLPGAHWCPHFTYDPVVSLDFTRIVQALGGIPQIGTLVTPDVTPAVISELRSLLAYDPLPV